jgi:hypothetical protein
MKDFWIGVGILVVGMLMIACSYSLMFPPRLDIPGAGFVALILGINGPFMLLWGLLVALVAIFNSAPLRELFLSCLGGAAMAGGALLYRPEAGRGTELHLLFGVTLFIAGLLALVWYGSEFVRSVASRFVKNSAV